MKVVTQKEWNETQSRLKEALRLASSHDPDLLRRIEVLERQVSRLGAPQYRLLRKGRRNSRRSK